jgi:hypothetical protein
VWGYTTIMTGNEAVAWNVDEELGFKQRKQVM